MRVEANPLGIRGNKLDRSRRAGIHSENPGNHFIREASGEILDMFTGVEGTHTHTLLQYFNLISFVTASTGLSGPTRDDSGWMKEAKKKPKTSVSSAFPPSKRPRFRAVILVGSATCSLFLPLPHSQLSLQQPPGRLDWRLNRPSRSVLSSVLNY